MWSFKVNASSAVPDRAWFTEGAGGKVHDLQGNTRSRDIRCTVVIPKEVWVDVFGVVVDGITPSVVTIWIRCPGDQANGCLVDVGSIDGDDKKKSPDDTLSLLPRCRQTEEVIDQIQDIDFCETRHG